MFIIFNQGFSRYATDGEWHVPHFEKMLYDQAQLMKSYADAYLATKNNYFAEIVNDIATYVIRDLRHKVSLFHLKICLYLFINFMFFRKVGFIVLKMQILILHMMHLQRKKVLFMYGLLWKSNHF